VTDNMGTIIMIVGELRNGVFNQAHISWIAIGVWGVEGGER